MLRWLRVLDNALSGDVGPHFVFGYRPKLCSIKLNQVLFWQSGKHKPTNRGLPALRICSFPKIYV